MKKEELIELSNRIQKKIGKEASALIQDDLGILITDNEPEILTWPKTM